MKLSFYLPLYKVVKQGFLLLLLLRGSRRRSLIFLCLLFITDWTYHSFYALAIDRNREVKFLFIQVESHFFIP